MASRALAKRPARRAPRRGNFAGLGRPRPVFLLAFGAAAVAFLFLKRKQIGALAVSAWSAAKKQVFVLSLPHEAQPYADVILRVSADKNIDPFVIAAIGQQESRWGAALSPQGPGGTGDAGHGHGIMQIDDRTWGEWLANNDWTNAEVNVSKGVDILVTNWKYFSGKGLSGAPLMKAALAAYNGGPGRVWRAIQAGNDPDVATTQGKYAQSVIDRMSGYMTSFSDKGGAQA